MPSSLDISSLEKVRPGIRPRFFNQKIEQNDPEKKIPSTQANATSLVAKLSSLIDSKWNSIELQNELETLVEKYSKITKELESPD